MEEFLEKGVRDTYEDAHSMFMYEMSKVVINEWSIRDAYLVAESDYDKKKLTWRYGIWGMKAKNAYSHDGFGLDPYPAPPAAPVQVVGGVYQAQPVQAIYRAYGNGLIGGNGQG